MSAPSDWGDERRKMGGASPPHRLLMPGIGGGMVGKRGEGARQTAAGLPPVLPRGVMWGR